MTTEFNLNFSESKVAGLAQNTDGFYAVAQQLGFIKNGFPDFAKAMQDFTSALSDASSKNKLDDHYYAWLVHLSDCYKHMDSHKGGLPDACRLDYKNRKFIYCIIINAF